MKKIMSIALVALLLLPLTLFAGGSKDTASTKAASVSTEKATAAEAAASVPNLAPSTEGVPASVTLTDKTVNVGYSTAIDSLTPFKSNTGRNSPYMIQLYETPAVINIDGELEPYVAKSWETEDDGFTYTVTIYDYVYDSAGNHITASDLVWFINESKVRALKPIWAKVAEAKVIDDYTLEIDLTSNIMGTIEAILGIDLMIVSEKAFTESSDEFGISCVSTSPYLVTSFTPSASLYYERRDDYWQDIALLPESVRPIVKNINYMIITEAFQLGVALETGVVDTAIDIAPSTGAQFVGKNDFAIFLQDGPQGWELFFSGHPSSIVAENQALRQAICYAIDANGLITALASGYGTQMWDVNPPSRIGFNQKWKEDSYYEYDAAKAKELIKESGYNGETLTLLGTSSANTSRLCQLIQNYLLAVGIKVELNLVDMALYTATRLDGSKYDMTVNTIGGLTLADHWSIRYDPAAYSTGDATSRKDYVLAELLYKTWVKSGWTEENIDEVRDYIKDTCIAYGMYNPQVFTIWSNKLNVKKIVRGGISGYPVFSACQYD